MKKTPLIIFSAISLLLLQACGGGGGDGASGTPVTPSSLAISSLPRDTAPNVPAPDTAALVAGNTAFATDLYATLRNDTTFANKNLFFSPYSISEAFVMTYAGARGTTASELQATMHFTLPDARLHAAFGALDLALASPPPTADGQAPFTLRVANSMWCEQTTHFQQPFLDTLAVNYGAGVRLVDFKNAPDPARITINDWVAEQTDNKILNLIPKGNIDNLTRLVLTNAVYFKGSWSMPFPEQATADGTFHAVSGDTVTKMMKQQLTAPYGAGNGWRAIALPYDGGLTFTAILPDNLATFESSLNPATLTNINHSLAPTLVELTMPKFTIPGTTFSLKDALKTLGTTTIFSDQANLTGITTDKPSLLVTDAVHQAFISVDEKSTEAAAAIGVIIGDWSLVVPSSPPEPVILTLDKPFIFFISDSATGAIIFLGRYVDGH